LNLTVKEKEKYVLKLREEGKTYRDIAHELRMSPREISKILKKANGEIEEKERKKIVLSNTAKALQLFKRGKSPTEVAIKLDLSPQEANSLYLNYLSLNNLHHFVETFKEFDNDSLQDFIDYYDFMKENGITKEETVEAIKLSNDYPKIKEEYHDISDQLPNLQRQRNFYLSDNKILLCKNWELNKEHDSLVSKIKSQNRTLELTENELNKKIELLNSIKNSEEYANLKNQIEQQLNDFLNQRKEFFKLVVTTILDMIKEDPEKEILINNILYPNENPQFGFFIISYEEKIARIADNLSDNALEINTNNILNS
jgi:DNA-binding CsgD family transcriptional regulator